MARPHIEPFCDRDEAFKTLLLPNLRGGMHYKMLSFDNDSGACSMTVQFDGGYQQKPGYSWYEMELIVIEGELKYGDRVFRKGHYAFVNVWRPVNAPDRLLKLFAEKWGGLLPLGRGSDRESAIEAAPKR